MFDIQDADFMLNSQKNTCFLGNNMIYLSCTMCTLRAARDGRSSGATLGCRAAPRLLGASLLPSTSGLSGALQLSESLAAQLFLLGPFPGASARPRLRRGARLVSQPPRLRGTGPAALGPEGRLAGWQHYHTLVSLRGAQPGAALRRGPTSTAL